MKKKEKFEVKCEKCGKSQLKDKKKSNDNWDVFSCDQTCECGGKFATYANGKRVW